MEMKFYEKQYNELLDEYKELIQKARGRVRSIYEFDKEVEAINKMYQTSWCNNGVKMIMREEFEELLNSKYKFL